MEMLLLYAVLLAIFWGLLTRVAKRSETIVDNTFGSMAIASGVLPVKAQQFVDEAEHEADEKRADLKKRRETFTTKQANL